MTNFHRMSYNTYNMLYWSFTTKIRGRGVKIQECPPWLTQLPYNDHVKLLIPCSENNCKTTPYYQAHSPVYFLINGECAFLSRSNVAERTLLNVQNNYHFSLKNHGVPPPVLTPLSNPVVDLKVCQMQQWSKYDILARAAHDKWFIWILNTGSSKYPINVRATLLKKNNNKRQYVTTH